MKVQRLIQFAGIGVLLLAAAACSSTSERARDNDLHSTTPMNILYEVRRNDSLVKIATKLTGSGANWEEIARFNNINEPKALQIGKILTIPAYLVPDVDDRQLLAVAKPLAPAPRKIAEPAPGVSDIAPPLVIVERASSKKPEKSWLFQPSSLPGVTTATVVLHKANANRQFKITRITEEAGNTQHRASNRVLGQQIRVNGSYYPKGVYVQPSLGADLLMRVAPGTLLELEQSFGEWLQIRTEKGSGYIRANDAEILSAAETKQLLLSNNG